MKIWFDEKFNELSPPQPCGQSLFFNLIFGKRTIIVPGLVPEDLSTLAKDLRWPLPGTRKAWEEIAGQSMAHADFSAPLIWLPRGVYHNVPESPNVCKAWGRSIVEDVPECDLRRRAAIAIAAFLKEEMGPSYREAFVTAIQKSHSLKVALGPKGGTPEDLPEGFGEGSPEVLPESEAVAEVHPDPTDQERANGAPPSAEQGTLRLAAPRRQKDAPDAGKAALHAFVLTYEKRRASHRGLTLPRTSAGDWKMAKQFIAVVRDADRRQAMTENFITTKAKGYPWDGSRTLHQFLTHWQDIEAALVDVGVLERVIMLDEAANG